MPQYAYKTHPAIHFIKRVVSCGIWRRWGPSNSNNMAARHSDFFNRSIILCGIREKEIKLHNCLVVFSHYMNFSFLSLLDRLTTDLYGNRCIVKVWGKIRIKEKTNCVYRAISKLLTPTQTCLYIKL